MGVVIEIIELQSEKKCFLLCDQVRNYAIEMARRSEQSARCNEPLAGDQKEFMVIGIEFLRETVVLV